MSGITPEQIAELLTSGDNDYDEELNGWPGISAEGNVVRITFVPARETETGAEADEENGVFFLAVVVEGDETPIVIDRATFEQRVNERFDYAIRKLSFAAPEIWPAHIAALREQMLALDVDLSAALSVQGTEDGR